jgi:hypothetical protein
VRRRTRAIQIRRQEIDESFAPERVLALHRLEWRDGDAIVVDGGSRASRAKGAPQAMSRRDEDARTPSGCDRIAARLPSAAVEGRRGAAAALARRAPARAPAPCRPDAQLARDLRAQRSASEAIRGFALTAIRRR